MSMDREAQSAFKKHENGGVSSLRQFQPILNEPTKNQAKTLGADKSKNRNYQSSYLANQTDAFADRQPRVKQKRQSHKSPQNRQQFENQCSSSPNFREPAVPQTGYPMTTESSFFKPSGIPQVGRLMSQSKNRGEPSGSFYLARQTSQERMHSTAEQLMHQGSDEMNYQNYAPQQERGSPGTAPNHFVSVKSRQNVTSQQPVMILVDGEGSSQSVLKQRHQKNTVEKLTNPMKVRPLPGKSVLDETWKQDMLQKFQSKNRVINKVERYDSVPTKLDAYRKDNYQYQEWLKQRQQRKAMIPNQIQPNNSDLLDLHIYDDADENVSMKVHQTSRRPGMADSQLLDGALSPGTQQQFKLQPPYLTKKEYAQTSSTFHIHKGQSTMDQVHLLDESAQIEHDMNTDQKPALPERDIYSIQQSHKDETINSLMNKQEYDSLQQTEEDHETDSFLRQSQQKQASHSKLPAGIMVGTQRWRHHEPTIQSSAVKKMNMQQEDYVSTKKRMQQEFVKAKRDSQERESQNSSTKNGYGSALQSQMVSTQGHEEAEHQVSNETINLPEEQSPIKVYGTDEKSEAERKRKVRQQKREEAYKKSKSKKYKKTKHRPVLMSNPLVNRYISESESYGSSEDDKEEATPQVGQDPSQSQSQSALEPNKQRSKDFVQEPLKNSKASKMAESKVSEPSNVKDLTPEQQSSYTEVPQLNKLLSHQKGQAKPILPPESVGDNGAAKKNKRQNAMLKRQKVQKDSYLTANQGESSESDEDSDGREFDDKSDGMGDKEGVEMKDLATIMHKQQSIQDQQLPDGQQLEVGITNLVKNYSEMPGLHRGRLEHDPDATRVEEAGTIDEQSQNLGTFGNEPRDKDKLNIPLSSQSKRKVGTPTKPVKRRITRKKKILKPQKRRVSLLGGTAGLVPQDYVQDADQSDSDLYTDEEQDSGEEYHESGYRSDLLQQKDNSQILGEKQGQQQWMSTSEVMKRYGKSRDRKYTKKKLELRSAEEKREHMDSVIKQLQLQNKSYFRGKEFCYDNRASFIQCVPDPDREGCYIAGQIRKQVEGMAEFGCAENLVQPSGGTFADQESEKLQYSLGTLGTTLLSKLQNTDESMSTDYRQRMIISFWRPNNEMAAGQYECWHMKEIKKDVVLMPLRKKRDFSTPEPKKDFTDKQIFFKGRDGRIFFFNKWNKDEDLMLNIIKFEKSHDEDADSDFKRKPKFQKLTIVSRSPACRRLQEQLGLRRMQDKVNFSFPSPTLVKFGNFDYLVITELIERRPRVSFYEVHHMNGIYGPPSYTIEGAELLIDCKLVHDEERKSSTPEFTFMTNAALLTRSTKNEEPSYARLLSETYVVKIKLDFFIALSNMSKEQQGYNIFDKLKRAKKYCLRSSSNQMAIFRVFSHTFPYVEAYEAKEATGLTLHLHGLEDQAAMCMSFMLVEAGTDEYIPEAFTGHIRLNRSKIQEPIHGDYSFIEGDKKGIAYGPSLARISKLGGTRYNLRTNMNPEDITWSTMSSRYQDLDLPELSIIKLNLDDDGKVLSGKAYITNPHPDGRNVLFTFKQDFNLTNTIDSDKDPTRAGDYQGESRIKLIFSVSQDRKGQSLYRDISLEGVFLNEPLRGAIIGQLTATRKNDKKPVRTNVWIERVNKARIYIENKYAMSRQQEFNVTIFQGVLQDTQDNIRMQHDAMNSTMVKHVHQIMKPKDSSSLYVLRGDLEEQMINQRARHDDTEDPQQYFRLVQITHQRYTKNDEIEKWDYQFENRKPKVVIEQKVFELSSEAYLRMKLYQSKAAPNVFQAMSITLNPLRLSFTFLMPCVHYKDNNFLRFISERPVPAREAIDAPQDQVKHFTATGQVRQEQLIYYPLLAYNSFVPDNSEIVITNLAEYDQPYDDESDQDLPDHASQSEINQSEINFDTSDRKAYKRRKRLTFVLKLGPDWSFVCFIQSPCQSKELKVRVSHCQLFFLAWYKPRQMYKVLMIDHDPWVTEKKFDLHVLTCDYIKTLPKAHDDLRGVHLITYANRKRENSRQQSREYQGSLVIQTTNELYGVSLQKRIPRIMTELVDRSTRQMKPRLMIRQRNDNGHLYCLIQKGTRDDVVKIDFSSEFETLRTTVIYESLNSKLQILEPDPFSQNCLLLVDDDQRVIKLLDEGDDDEGKGSVDAKASVLSIIDMSEHPLEDELAKLERKPWSSILITSDVIKADQICVSLSSQFTWNVDDQKDESLILREERNLHGTLFSLQKWRDVQTGAEVLRCKPLAGTNCIDLFGQYRLSAKIRAYLTGQHKILTEIKDDEGGLKCCQLVLFDEEGYICDDRELKKMKQQGQIRYSSTLSPFNERSFILRDTNDNGKDWQVICTKNGFVKIAKFERLIEYKEELRNQEEQLTKEEAYEKAMINVYFKQKQKQWYKTFEHILQTSSSLSTICDANSIKENIKIEQKWLAQNGDTIILASVLAKKIDDTDTIFNTEMTQSKSFSTQKWLGYYQFAHGRTKVVVVPCASLADQNEIKNSFSHQRFTFSKRKVIAKRKTRIVRNSSSHHLPKSTMSFGIIGQKLVWMNREEKLLQYCDLNQMAEYAEAKKAAEIFRKVECTTINLEAFYNIEFVSQIQSQVDISEIPQNSFLHFKMCYEQQCDDEQDAQKTKIVPKAESLMQMTIGNYAIVFDLEQKIDVAMIHDINDFERTMEFSHTGFNLKTNTRSFEINSTSSLGVQRQKNQGLSMVAFRAFSEMELKQIEQLAFSLKVDKSQKVGKAELSEIEPWTLAKVYNNETFFSLFSEMKAPYDLVNERLHSGKYTQMLNNARESKEFMRVLGYVLDRPTPVQLTNVQMGRRMGRYKTFITKGDSVSMGQSEFVAPSLIGQRSSYTQFNINEDFGKSVKGDNEQEFDLDYQSSAQRHDESEAFSPGLKSRYKKRNTRMQGLNFQHLEEQKLLNHTEMFKSEKPTDGLPELDLNQSVDHPCSLSMLKQCLLFNDYLPAKSLYMIASQLDLYLSDYIDNIGDLELMFEQIPSQLYRPVLNKLQVNMTTKPIAKLSMKRKKVAIKPQISVSRQDSLLVQQDDIQPRNRNADNMEELDVIVSLLPYKKIFPKQKMFRVIDQKIQQTKGTVLINAIFKAFWKEEQRQIIRRSFVPFLTFFIIVNIYYTQCMFAPERPVQGVWEEIQDFSGNDNWTGETVYEDLMIEPILWIIFACFAFYMMILECIQVSGDKKGYLCKLSNVFDLCSIIFNISALVMRRLLVYTDANGHLTLSKVRLVASCGIVCIYFQFMFQLRVYDKMAPYVELVMMTFHDIKSFVTILFIFIFCFMSGFYMIQLNRLDPPYSDAKEPLYPPDNYNGYHYFQGLFNMYLLILGDFGNLSLMRNEDDYLPEEKTWIGIENFLSHLYFLLATFVTQIMIFNMLISIMGKTQERQDELSDETSKKQRLRIQNEFTQQQSVLKRLFSWLCCSKCCSAKGKQSQSEQQKYLVVVRPISEYQEGIVVTDAQSAAVASQLSAGDARSSAQGRVGGDESKFREIESILNNKVLKTLIEMTSDTATRLDTLELGNKEMQDALKRNTQTQIDSVKQELNERVSGVEHKLEQNKKDYDQRMNQFESKMGKLEQSIAQVKEDVNEKLHKDQCLMKIDMAEIKTQTNFNKQYTENVLKIVRQIQEQLGGGGKK